ncbi:tetratricopeptide repeat protein [Bradyrhizobium sp. USDA 4452]
MFGRVAVLAPPDELVELLHNLAQRYPSNSRISKLLALTYFEIGEVAQSVSIYKSIVEQFPRDLDAQFQLADVYLKTSNLDSALRLYENLVDRAPRKRKYRKALISTLRAVGRREEAERYL